MPEHPQAYAGLRRQIDQLPVIDCHEHAEGPAKAPDVREPIAALLMGYLASTIATVALPRSAEARPDLRTFLEAPDIPTEEKWPLFAALWRRIEHTAYARVTKLIMRDVYGEDEMSLPALQRIRERLVDLRDPNIYRATLDKAGIRCRLVDIWPDMKAFLSGRQQIYERDRLLISLPQFHSLSKWEEVYAITQTIDRTVTNLDDYLAVCREIFRRMQERGALGMKDQSAYHRTLAYDNPTHAEAESIFNRFMADPRRTASWPEAKPLDDFLFHRFMEMARELGMPVQIHTGHMAGMWNDIGKTNAVHFIPVLEMHREVRFDLFHGNWPYMGEYLYIGKNFPNVNLDLCWLHIIDPIYARQLLSEALTVLPHTKIHAFGGDYGDNVLHAVAHLTIARAVVAEALAERVESGWISERQAMQIAADWFFNDPNEFFALGFDRLNV